MRIRYTFGFALALGALIAPLRAQDTAQTKPGGLNKVAHNVSKTFKKAGRDTKAEAKRASSGAHRALTANGKEAKEDLKNATGVTSETPDSTHKPGGLNKVARDVSHASKKAGAGAKHALKHASSAAHKEATDAGKGTKEAVKKP